MSPFQNLAEHANEHRQMSQDGLMTDEMLWTTKLTAAEFGKGRAWFSDIGAMGYSDGVAWTLQKRLSSKTNSIGTRILQGRTGAFDNSTVKTFRAVYEVAAAGFDAVRPIFLNGSTSVTYTVALCNARAIGAMTDNIGSIGSVPVTLPSSGVVPVSLSSSRGNYLLGNWVDLNSVPRTDGGSGALVAFDAYITTAASITIMGNGTSDVLTGWATRANRKARFRHSDGDCVTDSANFNSTIDRDQSPIVGLQYSARGQVITVFNVGDSIATGWGTIKAEGFGVPACESAQTETGIPFELANVAWPGLNVSQYRTQIDDLITAGIKPDVCIISNGSPNVFNPPITDAQINLCKASLGYMNRICDANDILSLIWTVLPANPSSKNYDATDTKRIAMNTECLAYPGNITMDFSTVLSGVTDADGQVNMLAGSTTDGLHPNDTGNALLADYLKDYLVRLV